jgi:Protein of unknown function (DUF3105)
MSKRPNSRLQRRDERAARLPGGVPNTRRARGSRPQARKAGGLFDSVPWIPVGAVAGVALLAAFIVYLVAQQNNVDATIDWLEAERDSSSSLPGQYFPPHAGADGVNDTATNPNSDDRRHLANTVNVPICTQEQIDTNSITNPVCYTSNPPTSGPHSGDVGAFQIYENPVREAPLEGLHKENLVHSMEHGGVVVWYNTANQQAVDQLRDIVEDNLDRRRQVTLVAYPGMEPDTIAVTAWTRLDKFPVNQLSEDRVQDFIDAHHKRFNPEGL